MQLRRTVTLNPEKGSSKKGFTSGGTMVRILGVHQTNEVKATQNLAIIVLFFMICWIPLYTINCILAFRPDFHVNSTFMLCCIILSHLNSAGNPILYAYHLRDFRAALKNFFCNLLGKKELCEDLNRTNFSTYRYQTRKKSSLASLYNYNRSGKVRSFNTDPVSTINKYPDLMSRDTDRREINAIMWNISEHSSDSSDSIKISDHDKTLMIRPPTPFHQIYSTGINAAYVSTKFDRNEQDDGFIEEEAYNEYLPGDTYLSKRSGKQEPYSPEWNKSLSNSSPHLTKLFFIENEDNMTTSWAKSEPKNILSLCLSDGCSSDNIHFKLSSSNHVETKQGLCRSFSDSGNVCVKYTVSNGMLSCGS